MDRRWLVGLVVFMLAGALTAGQQYVTDSGVSPMDAWAPLLAALAAMAREWMERRPA